MSGRWIVGAVLVAALLITGCARVKPYQREQLAHPCMKEAPWPEIERADQHVYQVREGTGGATGTAGGGCGCN